jgi:alpha-glucosidase (family GH31 glycosyl hydrolase)
MLKLVIDYERADGNQAIKSHETGIPMLRPMIMEFPNDPSCPYLDRQYMFGDSLLVAPVFHEHIVQFYLPAGKWTDLFTDEVHAGPKWVTQENYPLDRIPAFVREGTVLVLGPQGIKIPDYEYGNVELEVRAYEIGDGEVEVKVPSGKGGEWAGTIKVQGGKVDGGSLKVSLKEGSGGNGF